MFKTTIITSISSNSNKFIDHFLQNISEQSIFEDCQLFLACCGISMTCHTTLVCHDFAKLHNNVQFHYFVNDPGIYGIWNHVIKQSNTQFITNANVDDRLHPLAVEKHIKILESEPSIDLVYCFNLCTFKPNDDLRTTDSFSVYPTYPFNPKLMLNNNLPHNHPVWRSSLHNQYGYFDTSLKFAADWDFWLRCVCGGTQFKLLEEVLGLYYVNPQGKSTHSGTSIEKRIEETRIRKKYREMINELSRENTFR